MDMLLVFTREPRPGQAKLGLCPPLSHAQAALLAQAMLMDLLEQARAMHGVKCVVCFEPGSTPGFLPGPFAWLRQEGRDLGERLSRAFRYAFASGATRVLAVATDHPTLPQERLGQAFQALDDCSLALGPAEDGGGYLLGMARYLPSVLESVAWDTPFVSEGLRRVAAAMGLSFRELPSWYDVDRPEDLRRLRQELKAAPALAPHTAALLASLPQAL